MRRLFVVIAGAAALAAANAAEVAPESLAHPFEKAELRGTAGKTFYKVGERMEFRLRLDDAYDIPEGGYFVKWRMFDDDGKSSEGREPLPLKDEIVLATTLAAPGFVRVSAEVVDGNGKAVRTPLKRDHDRIFFEGSAGAGVDQITQTNAAPPDFAEYWRRELQRLCATPLEVVSKEECETPRKDVRIYAVAVRAPKRHTRPASARIDDVDVVTGFLAVPRDETKKYPARVEFQGYGVHEQRTPQWFDGSFITFFVNAHGARLNAPREYYDKLKSDLKTLDSRGREWDYGLNPEENASPDTSYFNGVAMRACRALQFVKSLECWNGRDLVTSGGSQGGMQSIAAAALDRAVTRVECQIPWCCDIPSGDSKRIRQIWGAPWSPGMGYYTAANFAKLINSNATVEITRAALGDELCPPAGVAAFYNALECRKSITWLQGSTHGYVPQTMKEEFKFP